MTLSFSNLRIHRYIAHEVRNASRIKNDEKCELSDKISILDDKGEKALNQRIVKALGSDSHSIELDVVESAGGSSFHQITSLAAADEESFVKTSQALATRLSLTQTGPSIKDGILVVITGLLDECDRKFIGILKAESDAGFSKLRTGEGIILEYLEDLVFTQKQRLIKIACFVEKNDAQPPQTPATPEDYWVFVYDHLLSKDGNKNAAQYFYKTFLGCDLKKTAKQETKHFFESAKVAINALNADPEVKLDYRNGLTAYLRAPAGVISTAKFAEDFLKTEHRDIFSNKMKKSGVPVRGIAKDLTAINRRLTIRHMKLSSGIKISGSADVFASAVKIIDHDQESLTLRIQGNLETQS